MKREPSDEERMLAQALRKPMARAHAVGALESVVPGAKWSTSFTPTLKSLDELQKWIEPEKREAVTKEPPGQTAFELAAGRPLVFTGCNNPFAEDLESKARLFDEQVLPAGQCVSTREGYWAAWRSFVTFLLISGALSQALPATTTALKGFAMHLVMVGYSAASFTTFFEAIIDQHRQWGYELPVPVRTIHHWIASTQRHLGLPKRDKFFILPAHIKCIIQLPRDTLKHLRDVAIIVLGTICALRAREVAKLDVCDMLW
eukprot:2736387-Rhodomonas_salina.1